MSETPQPNEQNSYDLVLFLWARRKLIIGITLLAIVAGIAAAFLIKPLYKSEVIMFPAVTQSPSKSLLNEYASNSEDLLKLGDEEDSEHLLQILSSEKVRDRTAEKFDLYNAYGIKPDSRTRIAELNDTYSDLVQFEYTKYSSVRTSVMDHDPIRAADMANFIADQADTVWSEMARERAEKGYEVVKREVAELEANVALMGDSLMTLRELGVHDYNSQAERFNEYLGAAILKGDKRAIGEFDERFKVLAKYGGAYNTLQLQLLNETNRLSAMRMKLKHAEADMRNELSHRFVVDRAVPADKKSYPIRWLVVVISAVAGLILALLLIAVQVNIQKIRESNG